MSLRKRVSAPPPPSQLRRQATTTSMVDYRQLPTEVQEIKIIANMSAPCLWGGIQTPGVTKDALANICPLTSTKRMKYGKEFDDAFQREMQISYILGCLSKFGTQMNQSQLVNAEQLINKLQRGAKLTDLDKSIVESCMLSWENIKHLPDVGRNVGIEQNAVANISIAMMEDLINKYEKIYIN